MGLVQGLPHRWYEGGSMLICEGLMFVSVKSIGISEWTLMQDYVREGGSS